MMADHSIDLVQCVRADLAGKPRPPYGKEPEKVLLQPSGPSIAGGPFCYHYRMSCLLTESDLKDLTDYQRKLEQRRWLDENGIPYRVHVDGLPRRRSVLG